MGVKVKGKIAKLIDSGCEHKQLVDQYTDELKQIKELILKGLTEKVGLDIANTYITENSNTLKIAESKAFEDIDPKTAFVMLHDAGRSDAFWAMVKVSMTEARKVFDETELAVLTKPKSPTQRWSWG